MKNHLTRVKLCFPKKKKFEVYTFLAICDSLIVEMKHRFKIYESIQNIFAFLFDYENTDLTQKRKSAKILVENYKDDLDEEFENEIIHFHEHLKLELDDKKIQHEKNKKNKSMLIFTCIKEILLQACFPNVAIAFRIYLTMPCSVAEGERSFSKLACIKNEKRTTMAQDRLNALSLICIEHELVKNIDFSDLINRFAAAKVRKINV